MSIFGRRKKETETKLEQMPMPPSPLESSPQPPTGLDDIKNNIKSDNEVMAPPLPPAPSQVSAPEFPQMEMPPAPSNDSSENVEEMPQESNSESEDDSLFNLDDFELPDLDLESSVSIPQNSHSRHQSSNNSSSKHINSHDDFLPTKGLSTSKENTYFLTTTEFKQLLELIDSVKSRVKTTAQRHMRIMSIKSEENIELEGLKKDFQFIEDKLYEVDSTIFDR